MGASDARASCRLPSWPLAALGVVTLVGLALRLTNVAESLWLDELHTGWVVRGTWSDVAWRAQIGNQSPLWFYAVKLVTMLGGESELTLRLLSLVAGTALIPAVYVLVCHWLASGNEVSRIAIPALLAAALVAVDPNCIFYATEARPYACLQLCAAVQLGLFWQILQHPTTRLRLGWIVLTALAFHLHYTGILIVLGELVFLAGYYVLARQVVCYRPWRAAFDWQLAAILCLPAIGHVLAVAQRREMWDSLKDQLRLEDFLGLFDLRYLIAAAAVAALWTIVRWIRREPVSRLTWHSILLVALWLAVPVLSAVAGLMTIDLDLPLPYLRRYLIALAIGPPLLAALLLAHLSRKAWQWTAAAVLLGLAIYDSRIIEQLQFDGRAVGDRSEDWRGAMAWLREQHETTGGQIEVYSGLIEERWTGLPADVRKMPQVAAYLHFPLHSLYPAPESKTDTDPTQWTVTRGPGNELRHWKEIDSTPVQERAFGGVTVTQWHTRRGVTSP